MELELKKACFDAYEAAGELTLTQEETAETIVPDYCPDIARIIETTGKVFLHSREMRDGRAEISGTVRVTVLYTPEGEGGIRTLEFAMPFTVETDGRSLPDCAALLAEGADRLFYFFLFPYRGGRDNLNPFLPTQHMSVEFLLPCLIPSHQSSIRSLHCDQKCIVKTVIMEFCHRV